MNQVVEHIPSLRRYARLLTGDSARADDLVQDTLERALRKSQQLDQPGSLRSWLLSIMHNRWASLCRDQRPEVEWHEDHSPVGPDTSQSLVLRLDTERALARLPDAQRAVLLLVVVEDLGYAEVAEILGVPLGTVMSRLSRARAAMRASLDGRPDPVAASGLRVITSGL
jgi:RNA polymerase sigma-70 factor (ECF subfamily)